MASFFIGFFLLSCIMKMETFYLKETTTMNKRVHLAGILFSTIFGLSFMFSKIALDTVLPIGLIAYRFILAYLVFEILRLTKIVKINFHRSHLKLALMVGLLQPVLYFLFETYGLNYLKSSEAGMMIALIPIFVTIFSAIILKEKPKPLQVFFILLSVGGIVFIQLNRTSNGFSHEFLGFFLLFLAVISAALFNIASRFSSKTIPTKELTYYMMLIGAITFNGIYLVTLIVQKRPLDYVRNLMHIELLLPILYLGIIASIGGFFLVNFTLKNLEAHVSSIYANLATIVSILAGYFLLNEAIYYYHIIGSAMIIIGVYGTVSLNRGIKRVKIK